MRELPHPSSFPSYHGNTNPLFLHPYQRTTSVYPASHTAEVPGLSGTVSATEPLQHGQLPAGTVSEDTVHRADSQVKRLFFLFKIHFLPIFKEFHVIFSPSNLIAPIPKISHVKT